MLRNVEAIGGFFAMFKSALQRDSNRVSAIIGFEF